MADEIAPAHQTNVQPAPAAAGAPPAAQPNAAPRNPVPASALPEAALLAKKQKWQQEAREAAMRELGIEDPDAWRAEQAKQREAFESQRKIQEEAERAKLSEVERYKADLKARDEELAAIKLDRDAKQREATVAKIEVLSRSAASVSAVSPDWLTPMTSVAASRRCVIEWVCIAVQPPRSSSVHSLARASGATRATSRRPRTLRSTACPA